MILVRLPVLEADNLVGIVTRTDVLRQLHQQQQSQAVTHSEGVSTSSFYFLQSRLKARINPQLLDLLEQAAQLAEKQGFTTVFSRRCCPRFTPSRIRRQAVINRFRFSGGWLLSYLSFPG
jgi:predicted transcriptional regulator